MIRFKDIPKEEKPRERLVKYGENNRYSYSLREFK